MAMTLKEVDHIALLARLDLTAEEKQRFQQQLSDILDYVAQLQQLDTDAIEPTSSVQPPHSRLREDEPTPGLSTQDALRNAPNAHNHQFRVPPVLE